MLPGYGEKLFGCMHSSREKLFPLSQALVRICAGSIERARLITNEIGRLH
jgi:hypothetical protein